MRRKRPDRAFLSFAPRQARPSTPAFRRDAAPAVGQSDRYTAGLCGASPELPPGGAARAIRPPVESWWARRQTGRQVADVALWLCVDPVRIFVRLRDVYARARSSSRR